MALLRYHSRIGRFTLMTAILGSGMAFLDTTAVNVALPAMGDDLGADFAAFQWIINGYLLTLASFVLVAGALGDVFGRRRIFLTGAVLFGASSIPCGLAPTPELLIAFRIVQGLGAALLIPTALAIVQTAFEPADRGRAIGSWSAFSGIMTLAGALLGGALIDLVSWRAIFLINPVLSGFVVWSAVRYVPRVVPPEARRPDFPGGVAAVLMLAGIVYPLIEGPERGWDRPLVLLAAAGGLLAAVAFVRIERRRADPMLPLGVFRDRTFAAANLVTFVMYGALASGFFLLTLQWQRVLGYSAFEAGAAGAPVTLSLFLVAPRAGRLLDRMGPARPLAAGLLIAAAGMALLSGVEVGDRYVTGVLPGVLGFGIGLGFAVPTVTSAALSALEDRHGGLAAGVNNVMSRVGQLLGVPLLPLAAGLSGIESVAGPVYSAGFSRAMWVAAGALALTGVFAAAALPHARMPARR